MATRSVIVIGAGIGGLAAACHLAARGLRVTVLEKNARPGGRCDRLQRDGHTFDTGPTLFVMPLLYEAEFAALGTSLHEALDLLPVDPTYRLAFDDGSQLSLTSDMACMHDQLEAIEPGSFGAFLRYLDEGHTHYKLVLDRLVNRNFRRLFDLLNPRDLSLLYRVKPFVNHYASMSGYFTDPRLKAAFTFQDIYMGLSPFRAPATFSMMPYTELAHGVCYPTGGMHTVAEALASRARQAGVEFRFNSPVQRIDTKESHARGVLLADGSYLAADAVLANADLPYVYQDLLPPDGLSRSVVRKEFSCSVISFFWGVDKTYQTLGPHTLFLVDDYRENFESITHCRGLAPNPSLYIHAPARLDPSMAPPGQDTLVAIVPVGHLSDSGEQDWDLIRDAARQHVFRRLRALGITDLPAHIKFEETFTPLTWRKRYNLLKGSTHGLSHKLTQMACFRPSNRHPRYRNLYFVGASTHPGTGMPTAMVSGRLASERIIEDLRLE
jgi:phytoene desaturase